MHAAMLKGTWVNSRGSQSNFLAAVGLFDQAKISVDDKGQLLVPIPGLNGKPRHWVEIAPFLWRDTGSHERLAAKVVDGKIVRYSIDELSAFMVFERAPWYRDSAWLLPALCASLAALLITAVSWPVIAIVRRRYGATLVLDHSSLRAYRLSKFAAILICTAFGLWAVTLTMMLKDNNNLASKFDGVVRLAQILGFVAFIGGFGLMLWNLRAVWRGTRRWPAKLWSIVLTIAAFIVLWIAFVFKLIGFGLNY
jgi:hypothetical protein